MWSPPWGLSCPDPPPNDDADHIRMLVDSNPHVPSRIEALIDRTGESPVPCLVEMARGLERQGADFLVIPCNTAHHYHAEVAAAVDVPVLNLIELTARDANRLRPDLTRVGLLASTALQHIRLYEPWFEEPGVRVLYPGSDVQQELMELIRAVKAGRYTPGQVAACDRAAEDLRALGAQCLVVACTELSVVVERLNTDLPVCDAADVLARAVIREALG
ncbi:MAG: aspartate/glutamate racemase family protein [Gammaproteobacteria bacterium]|nr:aspartate/glutamate racemase family protein [Gammaproteobacteria bacterium]